MMQRTRLNTLAVSLGDRTSRFVNNPWRKLSLQIIFLLLGAFIGQTTATTAGQTAQWDVSASALILVFVEIVNRIVYRADRSDKNFYIREFLNLFKIGITYSLFLEAFKLGS